MCQNFHVSDAVSLVTVDQRPQILYPESHSGSQTALVWNLSHTSLPSKVATTFNWSTDKTNLLWVQGHLGSVTELNSQIASGHAVYHRKHELLSFRAEKKQIQGPPAGFVPWSTKPRTVLGRVQPTKHPPSEWWSRVPAGLTRFLVLVVLAQSQQPHPISSLFLIHKGVLGRRVLKVTLQKGKPVLPGKVDS